MVAPSGEQLEIRADGYHAVVTECGASLRLLSYDERPLVLGWAEDEQTASGRGQLLAPWPNRIRDGRYSFEGADLQLPLSEPARGNASHGLVRWVAWRPEAHDEDSMSLTYRLMSQPGYPWTLDLRVRYRLSSSGLAVTFTATNLSASSAPYAVGAHPYLCAGPGPVDGWELTLPVATRLLVDDRLVPTGREDVRGTELDFSAGRPIGATSLDTAFTDLTRDEDGRARVGLRDPHSGSGVELWLDKNYGYLQVFTGDALPRHARESLAVEPMTAPADAFNTGDGLLVLAPDESLSVGWGIVAV